MIFDFAIIGGGIAGASIGAEIAPHASVALLEAEEQPGYHSTGRSAAFWHETLGGPLVQPLSIASHPTLEGGGFLSPRKCLNVAEVGNEPMLDALEAKFAGTGAKLSRLDHDGVRHWVPRAKPILTGGVLEEICSDIDVGRLLNHYIATFRRAGGVAEMGFRASYIERGTHWRIAAGDRVVEAKVIVNAAGAWADPVAVMAGAKSLGIEPKRRTIAQVRVNSDDVPADLPLTIDIAGTFYFKPEGPNRLWVCPHDETPTEPCDAAPEELDVAIAIDRLETVTEWQVVAVENKWAGLRTFAPDRLPVFGFDAQVEGFFWCAGQGGIGIQTAPAVSKVCAAILLGRAPEAVVAAIDPAPYSPARFDAGTMT